MPTPEAPLRLRSAFDALAIALFAAALAAPHWDELVRPAEERGPERYELRASAPWPGRPSGLADVQTWPARLEEWIADGMGWRDWLLGRNSALKLFAFGVAPSDTVLLGRDGFLFYAGNHTLEIQRGVRPFRGAELDAWVAYLEQRHAWCAERGIRHLFAVAPNKEGVYADHLPDWCAPLGPTRHDQLVERLRERGSPLELVDLRAAFRAARAGDTERDHLYSKLGTHWDGRGVWLAYDALLRRLTQQFPAVAPLPIEELARRPQDQNPDSWALRMYVEEHFDPHLTPTEWPEARRRRVQHSVLTGPGTTAHSTLDDATLPRAVFLHDSFGLGIDGLLAEHFADFRTVLTPIFDTELIEAARPDVVLELFVERIFDYWTPPPIDPGDPGDPGAPGAPPSDGAGGKARWRLALPDPGGALTARGALRLLPSYEEPAALEVVVSSTADTLVLPAVAALPGARSRLVLRMTAPAATELDLWFRRAGSADYRRKDVRSERVRAGSNELSIALEDEWLAAPLMLRPGRVPGRYRILSMEIRPAP